MFTLDISSVIECAWHVWCAIISEMTLSASKHVTYYLFFIFHLLQCESNNGQKISWVSIFHYSTNNFEQSSLLHALHTVYSKGDPFFKILPFVLSVTQFASDPFFQHWQNFSNVTHFSFFEPVFKILPILANVTYYSKCYRLFQM